MNLGLMNEEEKLFLRRLSDLAEQSGSQYAPRFTMFLNERQQMLASEYIRHRRVENTAFYGGYEEAARRLCGFFPVYSDPDGLGNHQAEFPVSAVTIRYPKDRPLAHRDFLGSFMALGIKRECVGDILPAEGLCTAFFTGHAASLVLRELDKVGNTGVSCAEGFDPQSLPSQQYEELRGTVGSARMDSLVKLCTGLAREKSAGLIRAGIVQRNYSQVESVSDGFGPGDTVSIRGYGKYVVGRIGDPTKKGRLPVLIRKYK